MAAYVHIDADGLDAAEFGGMSVNLARTTDRNAEFVLGFSCCNLVVRLGVDIGIDADGNRSNASLRTGDLGQELELVLRLDIDAKNTFFHCEREFLRRLTDAGEHDLFRSDACHSRALELSSRDDVSPRAQPGKCPYDGLIGIRFHRVADERVHIGERTDENLIVARECRSRIAIERSTDRACEHVQIYRLGVKDAVADNFLDARRYESYLHLLEGDPE